MPGLIETVDEKLIPLAQDRRTEHVSDICPICRERPAAFTCDSCERRACDSCLVPSSLLPRSRFCCDECRDEAELAAEQVRQSDAYGQWR